MFTICSCVGLRTNQKHRRFASHSLRLIAAKPGMTRRRDSAPPTARLKIQTVCKPGSVHTLAGAGRPFLWDVSCNTPRATNPGDGSKTLLLPYFRTKPAAPIRSCSRWGLPCQPCCQGRGALLPPRFTLPFRRACKEVCFLWHYPWGRPRRLLAGTVFPWSPDFPPPRFPPAAAVQPSGWWWSAPFYAARSSQLQMRRHRRRPGGRGVIRRAAQMAW